MTSAPAANYRGRHEVVRRGSRLPVPARRPAPRRWPAPLVISLAAALAYAGARLAGPLAEPRPAASEESLVAAAGDGVGQWTADTAAALQLAGWAAVRGSSVVAARELMVVAAVATVLLTGALARRFGLGLTATAIATVLAATLPWAVAVHRLVVPVNLAVPWLLAAALLGSRNTRRRLAAVPAALCLAVAVSTAPLVAPVTVLTVAALLANRDLGREWTRVNRAAGVGMLGVLAAGLFAMVAGLGGDDHGLRQAVPDVTPGPVDLVVGGVVVLGSAAGTTVRWLRPFASVVIGCAVVAASVAGTRAPLLALALPAAVIVLGATIDALPVAGGARRHVRPAPARTVVAVTLALLAGTALVVWS